MIGTTEHYPAALQDSSGHSGVSWAAIFAGAAAAAALSLLLLIVLIALSILLTAFTAARVTLRAAVATFSTLSEEL